MLYQFVSGDFPLTITFWIVLAVWANGHRSTLREFWSDPRPFWRLIGRSALVLSVVLPLWITLFDNWRQLLAYTQSSSERYKSDIFATSLTPDPVRWVSLALIAVSLVCLALLYARSQHGLGMLSLLLVFALLYFFFLNGFRMRADTFLVTTQNDLDHPGVFSTIAIFVWAATLYGFITSIIVAAYLWLFSVVAFPIYIIYGVIMRDRVDAEQKSLLTYVSMRSKSPDHATRDEIASHHS